ncbi:glycosyltransferase [Ornithinimicrobium sp. F0845]|uniref:glycosyltransferase n=1 Tax=Ornithinimicrobium sp. F0845 TaxID=2926412 RepID=UPI001FF52343|nr:glycosyltransferase [Ornithinimicrobium sp. F0845]MCK0110535.1 glycosyltransferase [Ornithinimicrobium sp. F0845]
MANPILWVNDPGGAEHLALTGWRALYDITDDWILANRPSSELARLRRQEAHLLARCGEVVVCSPTMARTKSAQREVQLIPNGVDLELYRTLRPRPSDLPSGPLALYVGTTHRDRVDLDLLRSSAITLKERTGGRLALVGPTPLPPSDVEALHATGVVTMGPRPSETVPAYLQHADVLIVPHVLTEFTASLDPIKAYEYRAARRPVVATPVPGFIRVIDPLVTTADPEDFPAKVAASINSPVPWSGDLPDDIPSWSQRVGQMSRVIASLWESDGSQPT